MAAKPFIIGISGKARSGKDTLAWLIVDALRPLGIDARRYGWADALKAVCRVEYGMKGKDAGRLQQVGVEYRDGVRAGHEYITSMDEPAKTPNVWVNALLDQITEDAPDIAIISDCRFPNELAAIKAAGGLTIRIERKDRPVTGRDDVHISETALDDASYDYTVNNDANMVSLAIRAGILSSLIKDKYREFRR